MNVTEFLRLHPNVKNDARVYLADNGFEKLHRAIEESEYLKETFSLRWLVKNYSLIVSGAFKGYKIFRKTQAYNSRLNIHTQNERKYSKEELDSFIDDVSKING